MDEPLKSMASLAGENQAATNPALPLSYLRSNVKLSCVVPLSTGLLSPPKASEY